MSLAVVRERVHGVAGRGAVNQDIALRAVGVIAAVFRLAFVAVAAVKGVVRLKKHVRRGGRGERAERERGKQQREQAFHKAFPPLIPFYGPIILH